ncbi:MAG TPA: ComEC/Rec2 family competence protein [Epsilonproteobacteria bacterium]|nr:ComEC/Rec2 family competence protein [Campylobacterota bacterium]
MAYLGTFYIKSKVKKVEPIPQTLKGTLLQEIDQQHSDEKMRSFYKAILFATPLDKNVRESVAGLGVSHLVALSGFHLAILWFTLYQLILFLYQPIQQRFFPYRWSLIDVGFVVMGLLGVYVWFVGAPPSLVRSYGMVLLGWLLVLMGVELLSFGFLYSVVLILLALFPALIVSIAFWFSVAGVHSIFLILQNSQSFHIKVVSFVVIPVGVFVLMLPISHTLFGMTTPYQLLSPVLSILFTFFYPLMIVLHLVGMGSIMDGQLPELLSLSCDMREELLPMEVIGLYVGIAFRAITSKKAFLLLVTLASLYGAYLYL